MLLNLNDSDAWSHAMVALAWDRRDQREKLRMLALEQAGRFNRQASAARVLELYAEAVSLPKRYLGGLDMSSTDAILFGFLDCLVPVPRSRGLNE